MESKMVETLGAIPDNREIWAVGSVSPTVAARNHSICCGPIAIAHVLGGGYPVGRGWSATTEALAHQIVREHNAHADMLAALLTAAIGFDAISITAMTTSDFQTRVSQMEDLAHSLAAEVRAAIAKARGER